MADTTEDGRTVDTHCPLCGTQMQRGIAEIGFAGRSFVNVIWREANARKPRRRPILRSGIFGTGGRKAWRCPACTAVLLPPDHHHDQPT